jgi:hypothetical protein
MPKKSKSVIEEGQTAPASDRKTVTIFKGSDGDAVEFQLDETNEDTDMLVKYFSSLREAEINKNDIYGETLKNLVAQLVFLCRMSGAMGVLHQTLGETMSSQDIMLYRNVDRSSETIAETIIEKFKPIPR